MSEPLSSRVRTDREVALQAIEENRELRARVAELNRFAAKDRARQNEIVADYVAQLEEMDADLAAAQEALKKLAEAATFYRRHSTFSEYGKPGVSAARRLRGALDDAENALARGGGQQETG